jgi:outer membrane protein OmpA-like peptidoglycan-associated protein
MKPTTKKVIVVVTILIIIGAGVYFYKKSRKKPIVPIEPIEPKIEPTKVLKDAFENLNFDFGKATIRESSFPSLDKLAEVLNESKDWKITIEGHTDDKGSLATNLKLSQNRANAVKEYLVKKGIASDVITATGFGETKPIVPNDSSANRDKNRRVEFKITKPNNEVITTTTTATTTATTTV